MSLRMQRWVPDFEDVRTIGWCRLDKKKYKECWAALHGRIINREMCVKCDFYRARL